MLHFSQSGISVWLLQTLKLNVKYLESVENVLFALDLRSFPIDHIVDEFFASYCAFNCRIDCIENLNKLFTFLIAFFEGELDTK